MYTFEEYISKHATVIQDKIIINVDLIKELYLSHQALYELQKKDYPYILTGIVDGTEVEINLKNTIDDELSKIICNLREQVQRLQNENTLLIYHKHN